MVIHSLEVGIVRLPVDGVGAKTVDKSTAQHWQEHFALVVVPFVFITQCFHFRDSFS